MSSLEPDDDCARCVDAAPYVLGALEGFESFREHLLTCARCRREVAQLQPVIDALPTTVTPKVTSEALRQRVLATVRSEAELLRAAGHEADEPPARAGRWRSRRLSLLSTGAAIATSAAVAAALVIGLHSSTSERVTPARVAASVRGAHAALRQFGGHAELVVSHMQQPPLGKIYEVWLKRDNGAAQPTDALFGVTSRGSGATNVPANLHGVRELMVTSEPLGGSVHPTSSPVIIVTLRA
jgi:anti-sigma-K factor RskA